MGQRVDRQNRQFDLSAALPAGARSCVHQVQPWRRPQPSPAAGCGRLVRHLAPAGQPDCQSRHRQTPEGDCGLMHEANDYRPLSPLFSPTSAYNNNLHRGFMTEEAKHERKDEHKNGQSTWLTRVTRSVVAYGGARTRERRLSTWQTTSRQATSSETSASLP